MRWRGTAWLVVGVALGAVLLGACGDDAPADGFQVVASGDTYGEWELQAEYEDGSWTGCLQMDHADDGPMCADPDEPFVRFEDRTGAQYGAVGEGEAAVFADGSGELDLVDDRFFVVIEGPVVELAQ